MCRYVSTTYTGCSHSKTATFRCDASFDAFPNSSTSACRAVEETRVRSSYPHCITCRRMGKGGPKLNPVSSLANRFINFIDGALGHNTKTKPKGPKTNYHDPNLSSFFSPFPFETADDVTSPTTTTSSIDELVDSDSWSTYVEKHAEDYMGIDAGWGAGTKNRDSYFSWNGDEELLFSVGPHPFRKNPIPFDPAHVDTPDTNTDDRASLPSLRSTPSPTSSLIPRPLSIQRTRAAARDSLRLPRPPREIPESLRAGRPRVGDEAIRIALSSGGHYGGGNRRNGICILPEFEPTDDEGIELDIPSYHGSEVSSEIDFELAGSEINLNVPDYHSSSDSESEIAELEAETSKSTPVKLEAPITDPAYDGSFYDDVVTALPDNWDWADTSSSRSPSPSPTSNRDKLLFQHPSLRQNWFTAPRPAAEPTRPHLATPAKVPGQPATHFEHFDLPVGGNEVEVPMYEGSLLGSISSFWA